MDEDAITAQLVGNTAQPVSVDVDDPVARGFFFRVGTNGRLNATMPLDVDYGLSLNDGEGETRTEKIHLKIKTGSESGH